MLQPRVRVVDDEPSVRESIAFIIRLAGFETVQYESAVQFLENDDLSRAGCLVLDIRMPNMTGLELQQELNRRKSSLPILFLTGYADVNMAVMALKNGAADFMEKPMNPEKMQTAVKKLVALHQTTVAHDSEINALQKLFATLTKREQEVIGEIAQGSSNKAIAEKFNLSIPTVKNHRANIYAKLLVANPVEVKNFLDRLLSEKPLNQSDDLRQVVHLR